MTTTSFVSDADGLTIVTYDWPTTASPARGVVQIAHGLAEHSARYARLAAALNDAGYHVGSTDHRGHGASIADAPGDFGAAGFAALWADMAQYGRSLRDAHPNLPLYLVAHSMGSFATQNLLLEDSDLYDGVVLSGSTLLDVAAAEAAASEAPPSDLSAYNAAFEHRTGYEWLSRDEAEVDAYVADPLCGFDLPETTIPAIFGGAERLADPKLLGTIRPDLPMLLMSGSDDPLARGGEAIETLGQRYRDAGVRDVTVTVYQGGRHELFNETNRDDVTRDLIDWLAAH